MATDVVRACVLRTSEAVAQAAWDAVCELVRQLASPDAECGEASLATRHIVPAVRAWEDAHCAWNGPAG